MNGVRSGPHARAVDWLSSPVGETGVWFVVN